jgi:FkbM family methyltransferase
MFIKKYIKQILNKFGYEIKRIDIFERVLLAEYTHNQDFTFIQIGSNDGVKFDRLYSFVTQHKCKGLVIEPLSYYFKKLKENYAFYPDIIPVNCAIHAEKKRANIYYINPTKLAEFPDWINGIGSFNKNHPKKYGISSEYIISEDVNCEHLMDIIIKYNIKKVNLLQIDTEGYDGEIINMIDFNIFTPSIIKYEHVNLDKNEQIQVIQLLNSNGYSMSYKIGDDSIAIYNRTKL